MYGAGLWRCGPCMKDVLELSLEEAGMKASQEGSCPPGKQVRSWGVCICMRGKDRGSAHTGLVVCVSKTTAGHRVGGLSRGCRYVSMSRWHWGPHRAP